MPYLSWLADAGGDDAARFAAGMRVDRGEETIVGVNKYAIDAVKPIRISVQNGHVELYGTVDTQADNLVRIYQTGIASSWWSIREFNVYPPGAAVQLISARVVG